MGGAQDEPIKVLATAPRPMQKATAFNRAAPVAALDDSEASGVFMATSAAPNMEKFKMMAAAPDMEKSEKKAEQSEAQVEEILKQDTILHRNFV